MSNDIKSLEATLIVIAITTLFSTGHWVGAVVLMIFAFLLAERGSSI